MNFEKLEVWKLSFELAVDIHNTVKNCRDWVFCDQIRRSSLSIPSNIAEGTERGTNKDSIRFLYYAKGSAGELYTQIKLGQRFGYVENEYAEKLGADCTRVNKMLTSLIKYRKSDGYFTHNP